MGWQAKAPAHNGAGDGGLLLCVLVGEVQNFDDVHDALAAAVETDSGLELEHAAGLAVATMVARVALTHSILCFRICMDISSARRCRCRRSRSRYRRPHFLEGQSGNGSQQLARRHTNMLAVSEVAGILVVTTHRRPEVGVQLERGEELGDVAHEAGKAARLFGVPGTSASNSPYSLRVEPQPAALVTMASKPPSRKASMLRQASLRPRRACRVEWRAPQQPCPRGPRPRSRCAGGRARWLREAAKLTLAMHPARRRRVWCARLRREGAADLAEEERRLGEGVRIWRSPRRPRSFNCPKPRRAL